MKTKFSRFISILVLFVVNLIPVWPSRAACFFPTGAMTVKRDMYFSQVLLTNGIVLAMGGSSSNNIETIQASADLYNPSTGTWTPTGNMTDSRAAMAAILLSNGNVLVAGGIDASYNILASAEIFNPATGTWTATGSMGLARQSPMMVLLPSGKVLIAGGSSWPDGGTYSAFSSSELYDPSTGMWTATGTLSTARDTGVAVVLNNGKVLAVGGSADGQNGLPSAEIYDPATGNWTLTGSMNVARLEHEAVLLPNGTVLAVGGYVTETVRATADAEIYDPASGTWSETGPLNLPRNVFTATVLCDGSVLATGGEAATFSPAFATSSAELYSLSSGKWTTIASMTTPRELHNATLLHSGMVLISGGDSDTMGTSLASCELFVNKPILNLIKAVKPTFSCLSVGTSYQLQISTNLMSWTNSGGPFVSTNSSMDYTQYFDVSDWNQLFFRLVTAGGD